MEKYLLIIFLMLLSLNANGVKKAYPGLFAVVTDVDKNDVLNVRKSTDYRSKKVGELPHNAYIGIDKCKKVKKATWCYVYPLVQQWYEKFGNDGHKGWVNARYLKFSNRGYVIVKGTRNCAYALSCNDGKCEVVDDYITDKEHNVQELKTQWIERKYLRGESNFGVTPDNMDGFCNNGMFIEDYLKDIR